MKCLPNNCLIFDFRPDSSEFVEMESAHAGLMPDKAKKEDLSEAEHPRAGLFKDDMPQNIITRVYNYKLDYVILTGSEDEIYIDNLKRTLVPDIAPKVQIVIHKVHRASGQKV